MNENELEKITKFGNQIHLSVEEKSELKERIVSQMKAVELKQLRGRNLRGFRFERLYHPHMAYYALALIFVLSSGSVLAAAGNSLPGNLLYPIKVGVNERVKGVFLTSVADKAQREIDLINKRLKEAQDLAVSEDLTERNRSIIEKQIEKHTERVKGYVKTGQADKELGQVIDFQTKLEVSLGVNDKILNSVDPVSQEVTPVLNKLRTELSEITFDKEIIRTHEEFPSLFAIGSDRMKIAEELLSQTEDFVHQNKMNLGTKNFYLNQLLQARNNLEQGKILLENKMSVEAIDLFEKVIKTSSEVRLLIEDTEKGLIKKEIIQGLIRPTAPSQTKVEAIVPQGKVQGIMKEIKQQGSSVKVPLPKTNNLR